MHDLLYASAFIYYIRQTMGLFVYGFSVVAVTVARMKLTETESVLPCDTLIVLTTELIARISYPWQLEDDHVNYTVGFFLCARS